MEKLKIELSNELSSILDFWQENTWDCENDGFIGAIDGYNRKDPKANKGIILNTRILWTFSAACNVLEGEKYAKTAHRAFEYISSYFLDQKNGGVYWELDYQGNPVNTKKQVYAQAFAIYALSEYFRFSKNEQAKKMAIELFQLLEEHCFDQVDSGYLEAYDEEWNLLEDLRLSDKDANEKKTMNTHLHVLEAYTNLLKIWHEDKLRSQLNNLIHIHLDKMLDKSSFHLNLFFDEKWALKSSEYSYGHDIEAAWLLCEAAEAVCDLKLLKKVRALAVEISEVTLKEGIDIDGGLMQEGRSGKTIDTDKHWWPQAEAIVGFANAYQISADKKYLNAVEDVWEFTKRRIIDPMDGEWWWRVNRGGAPYREEEKAGFWKCPYHNGRACIEIINRFS